MTGNIQMYDDARTKVYMANNSKTIEPKIIIGTTSGKSITQQLSYVSNAEAKSW